MTRSLLPLCLGLLLAAQVVGAENARFEPGELVVLLGDRTALTLGPTGDLDARDPELRSLLAKHGLSHYVALGVSGAGRALALKLRSHHPDFDPVHAAAEVSHASAIRAAAPNLMLTLHTTIPNDTYFAYQWHLNSTANADAQLPEAWDLGKGDTNTVIAVMDNGLDVGHPDLQSQVWINRAEIPGNAVDDDANGWVDDVRGWDFGNHDNDPISEPAFDPSGLDVGFHGTFVAGIAAAATDNTQGIAGAGWNCRFMALKVGDSAGDIPLAAVTEAFQYVVGQGAAVLNMSFGTADASGQTFFQALVDDANAAGILCVAAAGNSGVSTPTWPAACAGVLAVGATDESNARASFSNYGTWVDIAAPGSLIWSSICRNYQFDDTSALFYFLFFGWDGENPYMYGDGTSFASPLVAGICGLVRARMPWLTPAQVSAHMVATGDVVAYDQPIGPRVNAFRALNEPVVGVGPAVTGWTSLGAAWPNPFEATTTIAFSIAEGGPVRLALYDAGGRLVRMLVQASLPPGRHAVVWDGAGDEGTKLGGGIYFAALDAGGQRAVRKLVLSR